LILIFRINVSTYPNIESHQPNILEMAKKYFDNINAVAEAVSRYRRFLIFIQFLNDLANIG
ncbi:hypothetical protein K9M09_01010, partial [Patescibacteria group bacterium]|nr:hypothetical protein [Patescibacteria group bacterium]